MADTPPDTMSPTTLGLNLLDEIARDRRSLSDSDMAILATLWGVETLRGALALVDKRMVQLLHAPSGRAVWQVAGRHISSRHRQHASKDDSRTYSTFYICDAGMCTCLDYARRTALGGAGSSHPPCKHLLAVALAAALRSFKAKNVDDLSLAKALEVATELPPVAADPSLFPAPKTRALSEMRSDGASQPSMPLSTGASGNPLHDTLQPHRLSMDALFTPAATGPPDTAAVPNTLD